MDDPLPFATATTRVEVGSLVICVSFRNPALLAKMAATADAVAGDRLILGLGAGWYDPEYEAFGYPTDHRVTRRGGPPHHSAALARVERDRQWPLS